MNKNRLLVIFDAGYRSVGFVYKNPELTLEPTEYITEEDSTEINSILERLSKEKPKINQEIENDGAIGITTREISEDNDMFLFAVSEEFKRAGINARLVPNIIKSTLLYISKELSVKQRSQLIGELVNIPEDTEEEAIKEFESLLKDIANIKK